MPVAGLPTAVEVLLTSLLASDELSSWKVAGELGSIVVVLRFNPSGGQPLPENDTRRGYWRRKPPAQLRRDQLRAQRHQGLGEQKTRQSCLENNFENVANIEFDSVDVTARASRASTSSVPCASKALTFDPASSAVDSVTEETSEPEITVPDDTARDQPSREEPEWLRDFTAQLEAASEDHQNKLQEDLKRLTKSGEDERCSAGTIALDPSAHTDEHGHVNENTSRKSSPTEDPTSNRSHPNRLTLDCSTVPPPQPPSTRTSKQVNRQPTADGHNRRNDFSGGTGGTGCMRKTRGRPAAKQDQR